MNAFFWTIGNSDSHPSISASLLARLAVGCTAADAGGWVSLVAMNSSCPTRTCLRSRVDSPALTSGGREVVACGLPKTLGPFRSLYFVAASIQGQLPLLPLVLIVFRGYASIGLLPDQLQASIPSAGLALTQGASGPLISYPCQAATWQYREEGRRVGGCRR